MITPEKYPDRLIVDASVILADEEKVVRDEKEDIDWLFGVEFQRESYTLEKYMERPSKFKHDDPSQRGEKAWSLRKKSEAISSICMSIDLGPIKAQKKSLNKVLYRNVIEGNQRITSNRDYIKNLWALEEETYIFGEHEGERVLIDISGLYFKDLPKMLQRRILGYQFDVYLYDIDDNLKDELYYRWNNYEAHNKSELKKAHMTTQIQLSVNKYLKMNFSKVGFNESKTDRSEHMEPILAVMALVQTNNNTKLNQDTIEEMLYRNKISDDTSLLVEGASDFLEQVYEAAQSQYQPKIVKKLFSNKLKVSLLYSAVHAVADGVRVDDFLQWAADWFIVGISETEYFTSGGDANLNKVITRINIVTDAYRDQFMSQEFS
ncbi:hypothetical protein OM416_19330 [Paenibacillus sp. LS1]|uniref:hypothetical protein n=1 Tax=Paenibacillus sp. LS1 TaxID=2992120 RepID=UPI0022314381|nr:hypothetical protein [Paenibacillus sp. LS1]MCW3793749.1 hypothetical protein [Paenibacillus sp. LS1]